MDHPSNGSFKVSDSLAQMKEGVATSHVGTLRAGSFFDKSKLQLQAWLLLLYWWVKEYPVGDAAEEAKVSRVSAINVYQWLREVCSTKLLQIPTILGGQGTVVQIDESLFRHKPKVSEYVSKKCC